MSSTKKIYDEYTDLPISRQRKWQLRHPDKDRELKERWLNTDKGKRSRKESNRRWRERNNV